MGFNPFSVLTSKIFGGLALALLLALGVQTARLSIRTGQRDSYKLANDTMKKAYTAAQTAAHAKAVAAKIETENQYARISRQADVERAESNRLRDAADEYARTHRVRWEGPQGGSGRAAAPGSGDSPPSDNGPAGPSDWIAISPADYGRYNAIVERMQRVKKWADDLQQEGLAIPDPAF